MNDSAGGAIGKQVGEGGERSVDGVGRAVKGAGGAGDMVVAGGV